MLISVNGYLTEQRGNLAWIIAKATPGSEVKMVVRTLKDGKDHTVTATVSWRRGKAPLTGCVFATHATQASP